MYPYIIQGSNIVVVIDNKSQTINTAHPYYDTIKTAIKENDWETVKKYIDVKEAVVNFTSGKISVKNSVLYWNDKPLHNALASRIVNMLKDGFDISPMVNFMHNLMENPSKRSVDELYEFLEANSLPITPDGHFLAYKKVRDDYTDVYTGTISNKVGQYVTMPRNEVDDNRDRTCSHGLHFCSEGYLKSFGGDRIMILKINPRDCVSFPQDYNNTKGRCCAYEVIGELNGDTKETFTKSVQTNGNNVTQVASIFTSMFGSDYSLDDNIVGSGIKFGELLGFVDEVSKTFKFVATASDFTDCNTFRDLVISLQDVSDDDHLKNDYREFDEHGAQLSNTKSATRKRLIRKIKSLTK